MPKEIVVLDADTATVESDTADSHNADTELTLEEGVEEWFKQREVGSKGPMLNDDGTEKRDPADVSSGDQPTVDPDDAATVTDPDEGAHVDDGEGSPAAGASDDGTGDDGDSGDAAAGTDAGGATSPHLKIGDRDFDEATSKQMVELFDWAKGLPPEASAAVNAVLSGTHVPVPRDQFEALMKGQMNAPTPPAPKPEESPSLVEFDDPVAAAEIKRLRDEMTAIKDQATQAQRATAESQLAIQQSQQVELANQVAETFRNDKGLTEQEMMNLARSVAQAGIIPALQAQTGDSRRAINQALETVYWQTPEFRDREFARKMAAEQADNRQREEKKRKAGALAGGAAVPRVTPPQQLNKAQRDAAMVDELRSAMNNGTSN